MNESSGGDNNNPTDGVHRLVPKRNNNRRMKKAEQLNDNGDAEYYFKNRIEYLRAFEQSHGTLAAMYACEFSSGKYRSRIGKKDGQSLEIEIKKIRWYDRAAEQFFKKHLSVDNIEGIDKNGVFRHNMDV